MRSRPDNRGQVEAKVRKFYPNAKSAAPPPPPIASGASVVSAPWPVRRTQMGRHSGVANQNVLWHAGRLLALEEAHRPTVLDPETLETTGYGPFSTTAPAMCAHPKVRSVFSRPPRRGFRTGASFIDEWRHCLAIQLQS